MKGGQRRTSAKSKTHKKIDRLAKSVIYRRNERKRKNEDGQS